MPAGDVGCGVLLAIGSVSILYSLFFASNEKRKIEEAINALLNEVNRISDNISKLAKQKNTSKKRQERKYGSPSESEFLKGQQKIKSKNGKQRWTNGKTGKKKETYEWDYEHGGEIEVYDSNGKHKGVRDPKTGDWLEDPDKTKRPIEL